VFTGVVSKVGICYGTGWVKVVKLCGVWPSPSADMRVCAFEVNRAWGSGRRRLCSHTGMRCRYFSSDYEL
jgi:hypothetical protein